MTDELKKLHKAHRDYAAKRYEQAWTTVQSILSQNPMTSKANQLAAMIALRLGKTEVARQHINNAMRADPTDVEILNVEAEVHAMSHDVLAAITSWKRAIDQDRCYAPALQNLARYYVGHFRPHLAVELYGQLIKLSPDNADFVYRKSEALLKSERLDEARTVIERTKEVENSPRYALLYGKILFQSGAYDQALGQFEKTMHSAQYRHEALFSLCQLHYLLDRWSDAKIAIEDYLSKDKENPLMIATAIDILTKAGRYDHALSVFDDLPNDVANDPSILRQKADLFLALGKAEQAYQLARQALTLKPGDLRLMSSFALTALASENIEHCMIAAEQALKQVPSSQFWWAMLATAGRAKGQNYKYYYDYDRFVKVIDLEPPQGYESLSAFNRELKKALESIHDFRLAPLDQSVRLGTQTSPDLRFSSTRVIQDFFQAIDAPIRNFLTSLGTQAVHPFLKRNSGNYMISAAWSVKLGAGGYHVNHVHPEGWMSSSYYVDVPDETQGDQDRLGWLALGQPPYLRDRLGPEKFVQPKPGRLVLFPSYMWHGTIPITGTQSRLTLPFDIIPD